MALLLQRHWGKWSTTACLTQSEEQEQSNCKEKAEKYMVELIPVLKSFKKYVSGVLLFMQQKHWDCSKVSQIYYCIKMDSITNNQAEFLSNTKRSLKIEHNIQD